MDTQPYNGMRFKVRNLGAVQQGELTQRPLTIFCGPNNTGKTWVMYSLYHCYALIEWLKEQEKFSLLEAEKINVQNFNKIINERLVDVFNTNQDLLKNAQFTLKCSEEEFKNRIQNRYNPFLMPAERTGLHLFYRELSTRRTALLHHASKPNIDLGELLRDVMYSRYARPIANYIDWLNNLSESQRSGQDLFHDCGEYLKKQLVQGAYAVDPETSDITFEPESIEDGDQETRSMGLHMTSGTVKSLFGLWFYLEHQAKAGDLLMIDEPELNLHPRNQRIIARLLAKLVNSGLNVVVSTHSDYIVREFNSLIMLNHDHAQSLRKKHNYGDDEVLDPAKVGAYLFDKQTIAPFKISPNDGIYATTFDEVIRDLNQVNDDIYYSLQEAES